MNYLVLCISYLQAAKFLFSEITQVKERNLLESFDRFRINNSIVILTLVSSLYYEKLNTSVDIVINRSCESRERKSRNWMIDSFSNYKPNDFQYYQHLDRSHGLSSTHKLSRLDSVLNLCSE